MKRTLIASACLAATCLMAVGAAQAQDKVKIGFITDMSSLYADVEGKNGALAIQMAIDDFGGKVNGMPIELLQADHQNKADIAASKAREWIDTQGLTMLFGGTSSGTALAMAKVAQEKKRVFVVNGAGSSALTNEQCSPYTVHYAYDTVALAKGTGSAVIARGDKSWYFLTADYAFGQALEADASKVVKEKGGTVVGSVKHPLNTSDFSSFLLQAQNSKAQVLALANAGGDTINSIKAAKEFGITKTMKMVGLLVFVTDVHSLGLKNTEGLLLTTSWDWNLDDKTRAFGKRFFEKTKRMPTDIQAADYSATMTYLKAVQAAKTVDADKVMETIKATPIDDFYAKGTVRADGRFVHDMYLVQVKSPAESKQPWDYYKVIQKLKGEEVFTTKAESKCALWK
ncbi:MULTISPECIES: ABC transporter substrate-binding protein [Variovorax]|jgi:branched-chain amino acid transport system substrate-binding protein|uniref:ABC transporter substrate-binding protein n=1 Tax=Variovorax TaxID=34072 RepID=UPI00089C6AF6|nr:MULTISPECIES: ABC transporter substrate-binding protein [Variovorax]MDQ0085375.1 branched-chain amino acid transport system substrate-binding protein [Variovorax boronicumulans]UVH55238.1 ABC transporter substrate-binding protein [Variovorax paradoxus]SDY87940.1 amino acid/amide ABC transporter substrate-binding protein, HAAT family [Variovorax sp. YR634]SDZ63667.1 amino acid/amide ABC transporter substrate-binding protein, HAAT family [Variovorax sp. YR266]SOD29036.1 amino acid/amide ABC t